MHIRTYALALPLALSLATAAMAEAPTIRQQGSARLENVPEVPAEVSNAVQLYQNSRAASFQDWLDDGSMLIATRFGETSQLHHLTAPGAARTQLTFGREPVASASSISGTSQFIMRRDIGGDEWFQLYQKGLTGPAKLITQPGTRNQSAVISKDGSLMIWAQATKGSAAYNFFAVDPKSPAEPKLILKVDGAAGPADISMDGKTLLYARSISNRENQLFLLDIASGQSRQIAPNAPKSRIESARFLPSGQIVAISDLDSDTRRLVTIDPATGAQKPLIAGLKWDVEDIALSPSGLVLAYAVNEDGYSTVHLLNLISKQKLASPGFPKGVLTALKFSPDGRQLAAGFTSPTSAGDVWSYSLGDSKVTRWTASEMGELDAAKLSEPTLIRFKSFDGLSVPAFVYRPKGAAADAKTPVIIDIHGGPESQSRPIWNYGAQYFADVLGATVILPNVRGSDGYGKRYLNLDNAEKREDSVKDIGALLDWVKTQPGLDASRVAVYGQSYGGYMSLAVMTHYSDRLVGGVERYGISDFASFLNNTEAYRRDNRRAEYGDERDPKMQAVFKRISPMANIGRVTKPMLVMQGANDPRVPQSESDQVVAKLRANGIETWYVLFADEGHGFQKKPNNDLRREVETLFLQKLFTKP